MINFLCQSEKLIDDKLKDDLHWLRDQRNNIHLWKAKREYNRYDLSHYNRAVKIVQKLEEVLREFWQKFST